MNESELNPILETAAGVLIRCFILGIATLLFWFIMVVFLGDFAYAVHSKWFDISRQQFDYINFAGLCAAKLCIFFFFLFPWLSIKHLLCKKCCCSKNQCDPENGSGT